MSMLEKSDACTDCGEVLHDAEEEELGVCWKCLKQIRISEGRCGECGEHECTCKTV